MLQIYRRHLKSCSHTSLSYRRVAQWNAAGAIGAVKEEPARIDGVV
jgi:hypothetical protein